MDIKIFNVCLLVGWLMVLAGGMLVSPGWGLAVAGGLLIVLTLLSAYLGGLSQAQPKTRAGAEGSA